MDARAHTDLEQPTQTAPEGRILVMDRQTMRSTLGKTCGCFQTYNLFLLTIL